MPHSTSWACIAPQWRTRKRRLAGARHGNSGNDALTGDSLIHTSVEEFYRSKAMYVWWMLRDMIGESALKQVLAAYRPDADTTPGYLQHLIEAQTKRDLGWFFDDWVYRDSWLAGFQGGIGLSSKDGCQ